MALHPPPRVCKHLPHISAQQPQYETQYTVLPTPGTSPLTDPFVTTSGSPLRNPALPPPSPLNHLSSLPEVFLLPVTHHLPLLLLFYPPSLSLSFPPYFPFPLTRFHFLPVHLFLVLLSLDFAFLFLPGSLVFPYLPPSHSPRLAGLSLWVHLSQQVLTAREECLWTFLSPGRVTGTFPSPCRVPRSTSDPQETQGRPPVVRFVLRLHDHVHSSGSKSWVVQLRKDASLAQTEGGKGSARFLTSSTETSSCAWCGTSSAVVHHRPQTARQL